MFVRLYSASFAHDFPLAHIFFLTEEIDTSFDLFEKIRTPSRRQQNLQLDEVAAGS